LSRNFFLVSFGDIAQYSRQAYIADISCEATKVEVPKFQFSIPGRRYADIT
jgi:hypothetical protein